MTEFLIQLKIHTNEEELFAIKTIGARIKELRKNKKLTLEALAGEQLTKGMLSLIENNKAKPSMGNLYYIAERLGVETSVLLTEGDTIELKDMLKKVEQLYNAGDTKLLIELVRSNLPILNNFGYESARILEIYGECLHIHKSGDWKEVLNRAAAIYGQLNLLSKQVNISIYHAVNSFNEHNYDEALEILLSARAAINDKINYTEPITIIQLDYHEVMFQFAVGNSAEALCVLENAIEFSKSKKIYYRIDDLYRLASINAIIEKNTSELSHYKEKLLQHANFTRQKDALFNAFFVEINFLNSINSYENAISLIKINIDKFKGEKDYNLFLNNELGKSFYGLNQFKEALYYFQQVVIPDNLHHPFDLSILYEKDAYVASCYIKIGDIKKAIYYATKAYNNILNLPKNTNKSFATKVSEYLSNIK